MHIYNVPIDRIMWLSCRYSKFSSVIMLANYLFNPLRLYLTWSHTAHDFIYGCFYGFRSSSNSKFYFRILWEWKIEVGKRSMNRLIILQLFSNSEIINICRSMEIYEIDVRIKIVLNGGIHTHPGLNVWWKCFRFFFDDKLKYFEQNMHENGNIFI